MSKEVQMTFRVEPELRAEFADAALLEDSPAAQVLREFMRAYVIQSRERGQQPANDFISVAERRRREDATSFALGREPAQAKQKEVSPPDRPALGAGRVR